MLTTNVKLKNDIIASAFIYSLSLPYVTLLDLYFMQLAYVITKDFSNTQTFMIADLTSIIIHRYSLIVQLPIIGDCTIREYLSIVHVQILDHNVKR